MPSTQTPSDYLRDLITRGLQPSDVRRALRNYGVLSDPADLLDRLIPTGAGEVDSRQVITCFDPQWPERLHPLLDEGGPWWLWHSGTTAALDPSHSVAIVGTRRASADGLAIARTMARDLARAGVTIVSGMAKGIDQAAHHGALDGEGATIAVLGTGLAVDYPQGSARLKADLQAKGCLISEQPPTQPIVLPAQFLERNRIIAGLADAVIIIEAKTRSGALNTAGWAGQYDRDVLVVPASPNHPSAGGSLALLRDGALLVRHAQDVLEYLDLPTDPKEIQDLANKSHLMPGVDTHQGKTVGGGQGRGALPIDPASQDILALLGPTPVSTQTLIRQSGLPFTQVMAICGQLVDLGLAVIDPDGIALFHGHRASR